MSVKMIFGKGRFWPLFWVQFFGALNDNFFKNALVFLITFQGITLFGMESQSLVSLASGIFILPYFIFSPISGQLADKYEKSRIVQYTKILEITIMIVASVGFFLEEYSLLMVVLFLMGTQSALFGPVKYSMIPELVEEEELIQGNAYVELGTFLAILIGTIAGGLVVALPNASPWIGGGILSFAAIGYMISLFLQPVSIANPDLKLEVNPLPTMKHLWKIIREQEAIFNSVFAISWFWFIGAGILSVLPIYCKDYLFVGEEVVTAFLAMFTLGIALGSIVCEKLCYGRVEIGLVPIGSLGLSLFLADLSLVSPVWVVPDMELLTLTQFLELPNSIRLLVDFFLMSIFGGVFIVPLYTLLQERSRAEVRSQVIAANNIVNAVFMVASSLALIGFYASDLSLSQIFLTLSLMNIAVALYIYTVVPEFVLRFFTWILTNILFRLRVHGLDNIPKEGAVVLACNHITYVDWLILAGTCKRPARFVMYHKYFYIPILQNLMRQAKVIPICSSKEDPEILKKAMNSISEALKDGEVVCIFPEGRLTPDGELSEFRPGIVRMIERDPAPVVPMAMSNMFGSAFSLAKGNKWMQLFKTPWRRVELDIEPPTSAEEFDLESMKERIQQLIDIRQGK
jgi:1-acyl-sn-glycerol-3-phosphate acyltransferase